MVRELENSQIAITLSSSGATPFLQTRWPKKVISDTVKMHFFLLRIRP